MNDRDQARAEVFASVSTSSRAEIAMLLDHRPDLVRRALGMEQVGWRQQELLEDGHRLLDVDDDPIEHAEDEKNPNLTRVWAEPPTDQEPGAET